jgi:hypothetical protein
MKTVITDRKELLSYVTLFQEQIASLAQTEQAMTWAFPNGERESLVTYSVATDLGELLVAVPKKKWNGKRAHLFALDHRSGILAPDVEINIPDGLNRRVSGAYVQSGENVLICHRGGFTAYRGQIPKEISLAHFRKWLVSVADGDSETILISIASLGSKSLANDIAEFVFAVSELKKEFKADESAPTVKGRSANWRDGFEFEGEKTSGGQSPPNDYEYLHGPLCNALRRKLKKLVGNSPTFKVSSNENIDVAIVDKKSEKAVAIFEVKTSASLSEQLYSAHGQLAYYKYEYGGGKTALFLVLPKETKGQMNCLDFFQGAGIEVIYGEKERFIPSSGIAFPELVTRCLT